MTIHRGDCGHIKTHWDNHNKCINCSRCSRESTCSTCSSWSNSVWILAESRRILAARKKAMTARKKSQDPSVSSEERTNKHGSTAPHGGTSQGKTHIGGNSLGTCTQGSTPATGHRAMVTGLPTTNPLTAGQSPNGEEDTSSRPGMPGHKPPGMPGHRAPATGQSPSTGQMARKRLPVYQSPGTDHSVTSHWN